MFEKPFGAGEGAGRVTSGRRVEKLKAPGMSLRAVGGIV